MTVKIFGEADGRFVLYEDDFATFDFEEKQKRIIIEKHPGSKLTIQTEAGDTSRYRFIVSNRIFRFKGVITVTRNNSLFFH